MEVFSCLLPNELLLLNELDVAERVGCKFNCLIEAVFASIANVNDLDHFCLQAIVEHVGLIQVVFEISRAREDQSSHVDLVISNKIGDREFGDLANVVVTLFLA